MLSELQDSCKVYLRTTRILYVASILLPATTRESVELAEREAEKLGMSYKKLLRTYAMLQKLALAALSCPLGSSMVHIKQQNQSTPTVRPISTSASHPIRIFKPTIISTTAATIISSWYRGISYRRRNNALNNTEPNPSNELPPKPKHRRRNRNRPPPGVRKQLKQLRAMNCHNQSVESNPSSVGPSPISESITSDKFRNAS